jgi:hypothetical protein
MKQDVTLLTLVIPNVDTAEIACRINIRYNPCSQELNAHQGIRILTNFTSRFAP